jgi:oligoendopeptidase F
MNEMLLQDLVVSEAKTDKEKLFYLGIGLESLRGTFFRQTMFAEFELSMNKEVEAGNVLTGAKLTEMYLELLKRYHGHDKGVVTIDDLYGIEWAFIPHFYYDFYVFQYSTSIAAATKLAEKISSGDQNAQQDFINLLKAGGSDYPYDLMKETGIDMASPEPYQALITRMNNIMDQMEAILDK